MQPINYKQRKAIERLLKVNNTIYAKCGGEWLMLLSSGQPLERRWAVKVSEVQREGIRTALRLEQTKLAALRVIREKSLAREAVVA